MKVIRLDQIKILQEICSGFDLIWFNLLNLLQYHHTHRFLGILFQNSFEPIERISMPWIWLLFDQWRSNAIKIGEPDH